MKEKHYKTQHSKSRDYNLEIHQKKPDIVLLLI